MRHELIEYIDNDRDFIIEPNKKLEKFREYVREVYPNVNMKKKSRVIQINDYTPYYKPLSPLRRVEYNPKNKGIPKELPSLSKRKSPSVDELVDILKSLKK